MERLTIIDTHPNTSCCEPSVATDAMRPDEASRSLRMFKALADETRYAIFRLIASQEEPICACDIVDRFEVSQPTIAHHMKVLREAGLITVTRRGIWAYYAIDPRGVDDLQLVTQGFAGALQVRGAL